LGEFENANELIANASKIERQKDAPKEVPDKAAKKDKSVPKWKAQSLAFRQAILAAKGSSDPEAAKKAAELQKEINAANLASGGNVMESDMVRCPHCGRTFNKEAGERHIAICLKTFGKKLGRGPPGVQGGGKAPRPSKPSTPTSNDVPRGAILRGLSASRDRDPSVSREKRAQPGRRGSLSSSTRRG